MNHPIVDSSDGVTLVGGGPVSPALMRLALARAPRIVGADGGADRILALGHMPEAVVGDFDSISSAARARLAGKLFPVAEQATTDFDQDVVFLCPPEMRLRMRRGDRLSLWPLAAVTGRSTGLEWPIDGINFAPDGMIGTSNRVTAPDVLLKMDAPGMLAILPRNRLDAALTALRSAPRWPARPPAHPPGA